MNQFDLGYSAAIDTIKGNGDIAGLLTNLSGYSAATVELFAGATSCTLATFVALRDAGLVPTHTDAEIDSFLKSPPTIMAVELQRNLTAHAGGDNTRVADQLRAMCNVIDKHRGKINFNAPVVKSEAPQPLEVRVVNLPAPATEPTQVQVLSMPTRITTSEIERDAKGLIDYVVQSERDLLV